MYRLFRHERAAVKCFVFAIVGIDILHDLLFHLQVRQLSFQLLERLWIIRTDTAHAGAADFIKQPLNVAILFVVSITCCVLFSFLPYGEITPA